jgi:predicted XRE-type DNA-binding protein
MGMARQSFASVWDAIEKTPSGAARMKIRSSLLIAIDQKVRGWDVTDTEAAHRLGITPSRLNDLLRGRINKFSIDTLIGLAGNADLRVRIQIAKATRATNQPAKSA